MILFLLIFFYLGAIFWSFSTVLIERWHSGKGGIINGRSECPHCNNILKARDLFPIFTYLWNHGKCSFCKIHISLFYLIAEITMGIIFMLLAHSALYLNIDIYSTKFVLLLFFGFVTGVYILYDIRYMEIPDQIMIPAILLLIIIPFLSLLFVGYSDYTFHTFHISVIDRFLWALVLYTFFYIQILIPWWYYLIKNKKWRLLIDLITSYVLFPLHIFIEFFRKKRQEEDLEIPSWIWWGDLRIALFIGLTLGTFHGILSFWFAYIIGSIVWILLIILNIIQWKETASQIPFWPFLWLGWLLSIIYFNEIEIIINTYFQYVN